MASFSPGELLKSAGVAGGALAFAAALQAAAPPTPLARGAELYARTCSVCHGAQGEGYKADQAPKLADRDFLSSVSDGFLYRVIADGRPGTTMSAWGAQRRGPLNEADIRDVIVYLRHWDTRPPATLDERPALGDASRGASLYAKNCASCHGLNGTQGPAPRIGDADFLSASDNGFLRYAIEHGRRGTGMAGYGEKLGRPGVEDVLAYLRGLNAGPVPAASFAAGPAAFTAVSATLNRGGPEPEGFKLYPQTTPCDVVKAQLDRGARFAILDARAPSDYAQGHVAGAVSVPFYDPSPYLAALPKDAWLACYCACPHAESGQLARKLQENGFSKVTVLDEGFGYWKKKGYPTRAGAQP